MPAWLVTALVFLVKRLPLEQIVAAVLSFALRKLFEREGTQAQFELWRVRGRKISEAALVFNDILADGQVTSEEAVRARQVLVETLQAWSQAEPTPAAYTAEYRPQAQ